MKLKYLISTLALVILAPTANADLITFNFTGRLVVAGPDGTIIGPSYTPIDAILTFDTVSGIGASSLSISMADFFLGAPATFHDITMGPGSAPNLLDGNVLVDWNGTNNMDMHVEWDATGLYNAISFGLEVGDTISGTNLIRDGVTVFNVLSATPYSDSLQLLPEDMQGPAPLAATSASMGLGPETPFDGVRGYLDIGSGNSMHVVGVSAVPVPAAVWLFGSGLLVLVGFSKRKV